MSEQSSNDLGAFLAGFVIGGLVGAATAIILAPQSGQETRAQISARSTDIIHAGGAQVQHYRESSSEYAGRANEAVHSASGRAKEQARIVLDRGNDGHNGTADTGATGNDAPDVTAGDEAADA